MSITNDSSSTLERGDASAKGMMHSDVSAGTGLRHIIEEVVSDQLVQNRMALPTDWDLLKQTKAPAILRQSERPVSYFATRSLSGTDACSIGSAHLAIHVCV